MSFRYYATIATSAVEATGCLQAQGCARNKSKFFRGGVWPGYEAKGTYGTYCIYSINAVYTYIDILQ